MSTITTDPRVTLAALVQRPETAGEVASAQIPALLAALAGLQGALLARLVVEQNGNGAHAAQTPASPEAYLTADEAAARFRVTRRWLYRHAVQMGAHRLSRKAIRFSEAGIRRYLARLGRA